MENVKLSECVIGILVVGKNARSFSILHAYDHEGRVTADTNVTHAARGTPNTSLLHDAFGNVTNAADTAGNSWQFAYAANSTRTNEVFISSCLRDSVCQTNVLARRVDAYSRPVGYDLTLGDTPCSRVHYGYDAEGRIATLAATNAANRGFQVEYHNEAGYNYGYTLTTPNGAILTRTVARDPYRRSLTLDCTTRFNNVVIASFAYSFDANSRPVTRNNDRFAYNDRDEIIGASIGTNRISHAYDTIGNHVLCAFNSVTNFYANNQLNQTTASYACVPSVGSSGNAAPPLFDGYDILSTNKFTWSAQGGLQRDGRFVYAFDAEDQLSSVTSSHLTNGAIRVVNAYDYRHRRISKTVYTMRDDSPPASPLAPPLPIERRTWCLQERHDFVYDNWNLIHETITAVVANSTTNVSEIEYFWGPDLSNTLQGAGGVGGLLAVSMNGVFYFPVYDNLGNIVKYLDENGNVVASYTYDDFGQMIEKTGPMATTFPFRFSTKYYEEETCLYYYGCRFYSPRMCCWINRDPFKERGGVNLTQFCRNQSQSLVDFLGLLAKGENIEVYDGLLDFGKGELGTINVVNFEFLKGREMYRRHKFLILLLFKPGNSFCKACDNDHLRWVQWVLSDTDIDPDKSPHDVFPWLDNKGNVEPYYPMLTGANEVFSAVRWTPNGQFRFSDTPTLYKRVDIGESVVSFRTCLVCDQTVDTVSSDLDKKEKNYTYKTLKCLDWTIKYGRRNVNGTVKEYFDAH